MQQEKHRGRKAFSCVTEEKSEQKNSEEQKERDVGLTKGPVDVAFWHRVFALLVNHFNSYEQCS